MADQKASWKTMVPSGWVGCNCAGSGFWHQDFAHLEHRGSFFHSTGWVLGPSAHVWARQTLLKGVQRDGNVVEGAAQSQHGE